MYPTIRLFGSSLPTFNLFIGLGILAALLFFEHSAKGKLSPRQTDKTVIALVLSTILGFFFAMVFDKLFHLRQVLEDGTLFQFTGMTFLGGLIGGALAFAVIYRILFKSYRGFAGVCNTVVPSLVLAHAFGRIGCFFGGCCYGRPSRFGMQYPVGGGAHIQYGGAKVIPVPLFEALFLFVLFFLLVFVIKRNLLIWYLASYGAFRFVAEFFRGDARGTILSPVLSPSQYLCLALLAAAALLFFRYSKRLKETP